MKQISIFSLVANTVTRYDHNKNGAVELRKPEGFWNKLRHPDGERSTYSYTNWSTPDTVSVSQTKYNNDRLFFVADKDGDKSVTPAELETAFKAYDKDGDGQLSKRGFGEWLWGVIAFKPVPKGELDLLNDEIGETAITHSVVFDTSAPSKSASRDTSK